MFPCPIKSADQVRLQGVKCNSKRFVWIPNDWIIPRGRVLMFGTGEHVAISTGKMIPLEEEKAKQHFQIEVGHGMLELDGATGTIKEGTIEDLYVDRPTYLAGVVVAPFPICTGKRNSKVTVAVVPDKTLQATLDAKRQAVQQEYDVIYQPQLAKAKENYEKQISNSRARIDAYKQELNDAAKGLSDDERKSRENSIERENSLMIKTQALIDKDKRGIEKKMSKAVDEEVKRRLEEEDKIKYVKEEMVDKAIKYDPVDPYNGLVTFRATPK
jgi:hypothetical protein